MEKEGALTLPTFLEMWNENFLSHPISAADLKSPVAVLKALLKIFERLGIDVDAVLMPPSEENLNENLIFYKDLRPFINVTRVINHLASDIPQFTLKINISHLLQPTETISYSILLVLFNLMLFNEERTEVIASLEEGLVSKTEHIKQLKEMKNHLIDMINEKAVEKVKRAERLQKINLEVDQYEEELQQEKERHDKEEQKLEGVLKECRQVDNILEQKKSQLEALLLEIEKKKALRVVDADAIKVQVETATKNVQEAEDNLHTLRNTLMEKENSLKMLQKIKANLDSANNMLNKISNLSHNLRDMENGDLDSDSKEGELDVLNTELSELEAQLNELRVAQADAAEKRKHNRAQRQQEKTQIINILRETEEKHRKCREESEKAAQRVQQIKKNTLRYEREKTEAVELLAGIKQDYIDNMQAIEEALLKKSKETEGKIKDKLLNRNFNG